MKKSKGVTIDPLKVSVGFKLANPDLFPPSGSHQGALRMTASAPLDEKTAHDSGKAPKGREMNKTEAQYLAILKAQHPEAKIRYEAYTLKLAEGCRYIPDFAVEFPSGELEFHEVKGAFIFSKALTKPKTAAELFPQRFILAQKLKGGRWEITILRGRRDRRP